MKVLVACECSGRIRVAFRDRGHDAWSCDIKKDELMLRGDPGNCEYHIQDDVLNHLDDGWDMMIGHPPCTYMCRNRARLNRREGRTIDTSLFTALLNAPIDKICIENPVPSLAANLPRYTQIIQPYQFGHDHSKKTCLWLKNLPKLEPTKVVPLTYITTPNGHRYTKGWYNTPRNSTDRSRTFMGIAIAMADQWGGETNEHNI
jgi:hypothetical protein